MAYVPDSQKGLPHAFTYEITNALYPPNMSQLVRLLDEVYCGPAWHGPSVRETLDSVTADVAVRKPDNRNSIWELVLHLAHGRHLLIERVRDANIDPFPRDIREPWWPILDYAPTAAAWRADVQLLDDYHAKLMDAVKSATPGQLARVPAGTEHSIADQLLNMAVHDGYHAGQIKLLSIELTAAQHSP